MQYKVMDPGPAPHGAGGLKSKRKYKEVIPCPRPAPHGAGGLKFDRLGIKRKTPRPAPHGAGGLKSAF